MESVSIGAQQHGMVVLDASRNVIRDAFLWNDTRSASSARDLIAEFGEERFATATGSVPVASFTITKLRWLRDNEPENAKRVAAVALPHDWLTWRMRGFGPNGASALGANFGELTTDRSDASGTGYFNSVTDEYDFALLEGALGHSVQVPRIVEPGGIAGKDEEGRLYGAGAGDNAAAALGLGLNVGDVAVSIGTSGTVFSSSIAPSHDLTGTVAGFADASGHYLSIGVTLNAARILKSATDLLAVDFEELSTLALSAKPGSDGLVLVPYFEGERTPNLPNAKGALHGMTLASSTRANFARAHIEGMLCGLANCLDVPIEVPVVSEYVAEGASVQAAWALTGKRPNWQPEISSKINTDAVALVREQYRAVTA